jgi:CheY-like chemotaxis protein
MEIVVAVGSAWNELTSTAQEVFREFRALSPLQQILAGSSLPLLGVLTAAGGMLWRAFKAWRRNLRLGSGRARIMVIDDQEAELELTSEALIASGYVVRAFSDPLKALAHFKRFDPDLVVVDGQMTPISGVETLRRFRKKKDVHAIMITGHPDRFGEAITITEGFDDYLVKPYMRAALLSRVQARLRRVQGLQA